MIRNKAGATGDWKDLYRLLITSLRTSSVHFQQLTFESATVGLWGLSKAHAAEHIAGLPGQLVTPAERTQVTEWVYWADVLLRTFDGATTAAAVASNVGVQEPCVLHFQPQSAPLLPAHAVIVDHSRNQILLLVRGTSTWADCLTDIVAHTEPLSTGHAHSGMLDCARSVLQHCVPILQQQLQETPGYRIHCLGHSLGGGVAALAAYLIRTSAEWREQLQAAAGVMATGFGTPPVMTQDLAESVATFTRTLVHDCDLVPRTCVASLAVLRSELEAQKDAVYANSSLLSSLKSSGILEGGASLLSTVATAAIASKFIPGAGTAGRSRWMAAGLQVGASMLMNKAKQMHEEVMSAAPAAAAAAAAAAQGIGPSSSTAAAPAVVEKSGSSGLAGLLSGQQSSSSTGSATVPAVAPGTTASTAAGATVAGESGSSRFSFAAMTQAVTAAAAAAAGSASSVASANTPQQPSQQPGLASQQPQEQQQQQSRSDGFRSGVPQTQQERYAEEEQAAKVCLYCPGQLWHLRRCTEAADESGCPYELVCAQKPGRERFGGKIWVKRTMLSDHYLSEHMQGLLKFQAQLVEQAAQQS